MTTQDLSYLDCNCFAIRQAARFVSQLYERHVSQAGVTAAQFTLLAAIHRRPGVTMAELADAMVMERTTLVRALKPLQRDGLVTAAQQDASTRAVALSLSDAGKKDARRSIAALARGTAGIRGQVRPGTRWRTEKVAARIDIDGMKQSPGLPPGVFLPHKVHMHYGD